MRKILYENPGVATFNLGDQIISESTKEQLAPCFANDFIVEISTHLPTNYYFGRRLKDFDYKFVLGSNILNPNPTYGYRKQWAISTWTTGIWGPAVLVGAGWSTYADKIASGQKRLWKSVLHSTLKHSVRDRFTLEKMRLLGFDNVLYTACPSMWSLSQDHCSCIPTAKADDVVFSLTDYRPDQERDLSLIRQLMAAYRHVYFWPQGIHDSDYFCKLLPSSERDRIVLVPPSLTVYDRLLEGQSSLDFVGTRLHGGIRALQKGRRALIIAVDNRAMEINRDTNLPVLERSRIETLSEMISSDIHYQLNLPFSAIDEWKSQFDG